MKALLWEPYIYDYFPKISGFQSSRNHTKDISLEQIKLEGVKDKRFFKNENQMNY